MSSFRKFVFVLAAIAFSFNASATVETFDAATGTHGGTYNGFTLDQSTWFHDAGRPYMEYWNQSHSITYTGTFTFNSLDFNYDPWAGYNGGNGTQLHMQFLSDTNAVLLDTTFAIPTNRSWITFSDTVANVHEILFFPTNGFWPSFDNLVYNTSSNVPEPGILGLLGLSLAGLAALRRRNKI